MEPGQQIGPFTIEKTLGSGAMGTVYRAIYTKTGQPVAIKMVLPGLHANTSVMARFDREVSILKQFSHPHIVKLYASGKYQGAPFYAMEYIDGEPLDRILQRRGRLDWREVVDLGKQLCEALQHAHEKGIVHRDLKPSNLMIMLDGSLKLTDFGIAKDLDVTQLTATNATIGTASYMSPEQCQGSKNLTAKSDLYALGVVFYEMLTGQHPFHADTLMDMFMQHVQGKFQKPSRHILDIPVWLDKLICQLLEKDPKNRPASAERVALALADIAQKATTPQAVKSPTIRADRTKGRGRDRGTNRNATIFGQSLIDAIRGKRKKGEPAWFEATWVQASGLAALLALVVFLLWQAYKPASADKLYAEASRLMESGESEDRDKARDGPIEAYLTRFPDRNDDQAQQIHTWADRVDLETRERALRNRFNRKITPEDDAERKAFAAVRRENEGDLSGADQVWEDLQQLKDSSDRRLRSFALLADQRRQELHTVTIDYRDMRQRMEESRRSGTEWQSLSRPKQMAAHAVRAELFGDPFRARELWQELHQQYEKDADQHMLLLMAGQRKRQLDDDIAKLGNKKADELRSELVGKEYQAAALLLEKGQSQDDRRRARAIAGDIVALYDKDPNLKDNVDRARKILDRKTP
jgi:serine/threonine-protein kinase